jgi:PAS domain S-box-containing protein
VLLNLIEGGRKRLTNEQSSVSLAAVLQWLPLAAFFFDVEARIVDCNRAAEDLAQQSRQRLICSGGPILFRSTNVNAESFPKNIIHRALSGESVRGERQAWQTVEGGVVDVLASASAVRDSGNQVVGALLLLDDTSQRQVNRRKDHHPENQVTAGLVHDFNNVLNTISQAVTVLASHRQRSEQDLSLLSIIGQAVHHGSETVSNFRRYLLGNEERRSHVNLCLLLEEVLRSVEPILQQKDGISVLRQMNEGCEVCANRDELRRVFTNLLNNALEAMPAGGVLTVKCTRAEEHVTVSIGDTGSGMPAEIQQKIFSAYFTTKAKGMGLGLFGARRAIRAQGGEISFESTPGIGTTFHIRLPLAETDRLPERRVA